LGIVEGQDSGKYVVEVSNERETYSVAPYERWELETEEELIARLDSELGWRSSEAAELAALEVVDGEDFEDTNDETGKTVRAYVKEEAVV
jgi:hypothetical protein